MNSSPSGENCRERQQTVGTYIGPPRDEPLKTGVMSKRKRDDDRSQRCRKEPSMKITAERVDANR